MRNVSEKCNREMTRGINARDEPTCYAVVLVARSLALFKINLESSDHMESTPAASPVVFDSKSGKTST